MSLKLTPAEEQLMKILWASNKIFMKEILASYDDPKPAPSTVATLLKRMQSKGFVDYKLYGNSREYFPLIKKNSYFGGKVQEMINKFFGGSDVAFASFFTEESKMNKEELEELKILIEQKIKETS